MIIHCIEETSTRYLIDSWKLRIERKCLESNVKVLVQDCECTGLEI